MSKTNSRIKNLIDAHSWLGVIISIFLFLVFWAGSVSFFRAEIEMWAEQPHHPIDSNAEDIPIIDIIEQKLTEYPFNNENHLTVVMPYEHSPYIQMAIDLKSDEDYSGPEQVAKINVDPKTGETISETEKFQLANFIYTLHYNMNLSTFGTYFIGFITLFFLFAVLSGIYIHAKKIFSNFFTYRIKKTRTKLLDMHNVVGVISLPFTLMYAISGLIFNLIIIYQLAFAIFLYQGDTNSLLSDAGYPAISAGPLSGEVLDMSYAQELIDQAEMQYGTTPQYLVFYNYGDQNALLEIGGENPSHFSGHYENFYQMRDGALLEDYSYDSDNNLREGIYVVAGLHFGDFAGIDLRILYFILGISVAGMIVVGNMLWINKRNKRTDASAKATLFVSNFTLGACSGLVLATAVAFLTERVLPFDITDRADWLVNTFVIVLAAVILSAYGMKNKKAFITYSLYATSATLLVTGFADWMMFGDTLIKLWQNDSKEVLGVQIGLLVFAGFCLWIATLIQRQASTQNQQLAANPGISAQI